MDLIDTTLALLLAVGLGLVIGLERDHRGKPAGARTNAVVSGAAAAFGLLSLSLGDGDPGRIAAQVVSGIGFLGGGAIFASRGHPTGLTTAAALWGSAAVGLSAGLGRPWLAIALTGVLWLTLWPLDKLVAAVAGSRRSRTHRLTVICADLGQLGVVRTAVLAVPGVALRGVDMIPFGEQVRAELMLHGPEHALAAAGRAAEQVALFATGTQVTDPFA